MWCDNCSGQNKNHMTAMIAIYLLARGIFTSVDMKFLVTGHIYMSCDGDFGIIEKRTKLCKAMIPAEIEDIMTKETDKFLNTTEMEISKASWIRFGIDKSNKLF
ncbi:hypothetical protein PR048_015991 [Dryococelus australis]|uniref:DUF7869 domain-containing protein n=1 Tax=Dryococelus australis TaxID=614101 RepID=A0ABQ9HIJ2_9NEOP|nr:hypothetical protein PR048_015991 [Dryococelus australis]